MQKKIVFVLMTIFLLVSCQAKKEMITSQDQTGVITAQNSNQVLTCKMLPEDLKVRKEIVLNNLKRQVRERKELANGYAFRFPGNNEMIDELMEFIKTERECCDFFIFNLSVSGDKSEAWLTMTGVEGAKDFITEELGL